LGVARSGRKRKHQEHAFGASERRGSGEDRRSAEAVVQGEQRRERDREKHKALRIDHGEDEPHREHRCVDRRPARDRLGEMTPP